MSWKYDWLYEIQFTSLGNSREREHTGSRAHRVGEEPHCGVGWAASRPGEGASALGLGSVSPAPAPAPASHSVAVIAPPRGQDTAHSRTELAAGQVPPDETAMSYTRKQAPSLASELENKT